MKKIQFIIYIIILMSLFCITPYIVSAAVPEPDFTAVPTSGSSPLIVTFTDTSICNPVCSRWYWDINNDGGIDYTDQNPVHTYTYAGVYSIRLYAGNIDGTSVTTKVMYITVDTIPMPTTLPTPVGVWGAGYGASPNGSGAFSYQMDMQYDVRNGTYTKYWLNNLTTNGSLDILGLGKGVMLPIQYKFGFWIYVIIWLLYLFAVWVRTQDLVLPLVIGILSVGVFGILFPNEALPIIFVMLAVIGAILIFKAFKDS